MTSDLTFALQLADIAAQITMASFGERHVAELKKDDTPVTQVDRATEHAIREAIASRFPDDGVLGEEEGSRAGSSGRLWIVDPLDGTKLYAEGIPLWTTLIGLRVDGLMQLGVADAPALGERYHATRGGGAWRGDRRISVSDVGRLSDSFVLHSGVDEWAAGSRMDALIRLATGARGARGLSDAWGHLLIAHGSAELLLEHEPCFEWDWAPTGLIVEEAGGRMSTLTGELPYPGCDLIVSNGRVHDEALAMLAAGQAVVPTP